MAEQRNSRRLPWLVKSCILDAKPPTPPLRRRTDFAAVTILSLPDDLLLECLSRVHPASIPSLPSVCRRFSLLLDSPSFLHRRRSPHILLALAVDFSLLSTSSIPLPFSHSSSSLSTSSISDLPVPLSHASAVAIGRWIYLVGRGSTVRFDAWTGAVESRAPTLVPRKKFAAAALGGRIYVAGGAARSSAVEEYDPASDTWREVGQAPRRRYGCFGAAAGGVFYVVGGLRVGEGGRERLGAHVWAGTMDGFEVEKATWRLGGVAVPGGGCVIGACGAGTRVYVVASHAVEVSFWRWEPSGRRGGEWRRLEAPPLVPAVVRFCCAALGEEMIVAMAQVSSSCLGGGGGALLVYDIAAGKWSGGPGFPPGFGRAALACVDW